MGNNPRNRYQHFVKEWREAKGFTKSKLAKASRVPIQYVYRWENHKVALTQRMMKKLARALDCRPADLLTDPRTPRIDNPALYASLAAIRDRVRQADALLDQLLLDAGRTKKKRATSPPTSGPYRAAP